MFNNPYNMYPYVNQMAATRMMPGMNASRMANMARMSGMNTAGATMGGIAKNATRQGFFKSLAGIKWGNVLTNTQKTLNVINQAIPVYYQIKPIWGNLKSLGKIMNAFNEPDNNNSSSTNQNLNTLNNNNRTVNQSTNETEKKEESVGLPTFFIS